MNIPIIGAGTAGPVLAIALRRAGHFPALYDSVATFGDVGGGINFAVNGMRLIKNLGLMQEFTAEGMPVRRIEFKKIDGRPIFDADCTVWERKYGVGNTAIRRSRMQNFFIDHARRLDVPIHNLKTLTAIDNSAASAGQRGVVATFSDGTTAAGDFLIGADGLHSATRRLLFGEEKARYTGIEAIIGIAPAASYDPHVTTILQGDGRQFGVYGIGKGEVLWFCGQEVPERQGMESWKAGKDADALAKEMSQMFASWGLAKRIVELVASSNRVIRYGIYDRDPIKSWSSGNCLLIGDAAHPMPPHLGQGGTTAFEDVGVLTELIKRLPANSTADDLKDMFRTFELMRMKRVTDIANGAREMGKMNSIKSPVLCAIRDTALAVVAKTMGLPVDSMYGYDYVEEVAKVPRK